MAPRSRSRPPSPLPVLLPPAFLVACWFRGHGPAEAALLLVLGILLILLAATGPRFRLLPAAAALLAAAGGIACLAPATGAMGRGDLPVGRPVARGRLVTLVTGPAGPVARLRGGERVLLPRHGVPRLDRLPRGAVPGALLEIPLRDEPARRFPAAACAASVRVLAPPRPRDRLLSLPARLRAAFLGRAARRLAGPRDDPGPGLALALVAGDRSRMLPAVRANLRAAGLAHVAVVSGLHFGLLVGGALLLLAPGSGPRHPRRFLVGLGLAPVLAVILPATPPVRRAALAAVLAAGGAAVGRTPDPLARVGGAGLILLLLDPALAASASFRLTIAAAGALAAAAAGGPRGGRRLRVALAPFLATWPLVVRLGGRVAPWAPLANLAAAPLVPPLLAAGWAALLTPRHPAALRETLAGVAILLARGLASVAAAFAGLPGSGRLAPAPSTAAALLHGLALAAWLLLPGGHPRARRLSAAVLALLVARDAGLLPPLAPHPAPAGVHVVDVGQGQAVLLAGREGGAVLVDTGDDRFREGTRNLLRSLARLGVRRLDALVLSHGDRDHAGGAPAVLRALPVGRVLLPPGLLDHPAGAILRRAATRRGIPLQPAARGATLRCGGIEIRVLHPPPGTRADGNDSSLVLLARVAGLTALVPGDAGKAAEELFVAGLRGRHLDLLLPAHHGARGGTGARLLAVAPSLLAAISCGRWNRHGHPDPRTVRRLEGAGTRVLSTARSGTLRVLVARGRLRVVPEFPAREPAGPPRPPPPD